MDVTFAKYEGAGNDFILIDDREVQFPLYDRALISSLCHRSQGVGADGVILIQNSKAADYFMRIFNADGGEAAMCGNGLRCFCLYLRKRGIHKSTLLVETLAGIYPCKIYKDKVKTLFPLPKVLLFEESFGERLQVTVVKAGVEHAIVFVDSLEDCPVDTLGAFIRYHPKLSPSGANVNFIEQTEEGANIRTYERGVEGETLACGTGAVATAFVLGRKKSLIVPKSGESLNCTLSNEGIYIEGKACHVFSGTLSSQKVKSLRQVAFQEM